MPQDQTMKKLDTAKKALSQARAKFPAAPRAISATEPLRSPANLTAMRSMVPTPSNAQAATDFLRSQTGGGRVNVGNVGIMAPKMHDGGTVPHDGVYELQEGERVVPAEEAAEGEAKVKIKLKGDAAKKFLHGRIDPASEVLNSVGSNEPADHGMRNRMKPNINRYYNDDGGVNEKYKTPHDRMPMENTGPNPAVSQAQQRAMAIAEHHPEKLQAKNRGLLKMTKSQLHDFAATPRKGLPKRAKK